MSKDGIIEFKCVHDSCKEILTFLIVDIGDGAKISCPSCRKEYRFGKELLEKFKKFAQLVEAVRNAEDILGQTNVGLDIQGHSVQVPYRILLTRLNTFLALDIGGTKINFRFRFEPLDDKIEG